MCSSCRASPVCHFKAPKRHRFATDNAALRCSALLFVWFRGLGEETCKRFVGHQKGCLALERGSAAAPAPATKDEAGWKLAVADGSVADDEDEGKKKGRMLNEATGGIDWAERNRMQRTQLIDSAGSSPGERLLALVVGTKPGFELFQRSLHLASRNWDLEQMAKLVDKSSRSYRLLDCHKGLLQDGFVSAVRTVLFDSDNAVPLDARQFRTFEGCHTVTAMCLAQNGSLFVYWGDKHAGYPAKMFLLLEDPENNSAIIHNDPFCLKDVFAIYVCRKFNSAKLLRSPACLLLVLCVAVLVRNDSIRIETRWTWVRNVLRAMGITHAARLQDLSARFCAFGQSEIDREHREITRAATDLPASSPVQEQKPQVKRRVGCWSAFVHKHGFAASPDDFHRIREEQGAEWEELQQLADLGVQAQEAGSRHAFGGRRRQRRSDSNFLAHLRSFAERPENSPAVQHVVHRSASIIDQLQAVSKRIMERNAKLVEEDAARCNGIRECVAPTGHNTSSQCPEPSPLDGVALRVHHFALPAYRVAKHFLERLPSRVLAAYREDWQDTHKPCEHHTARPISSKPYKVPVCRLARKCLCSESGKLCAKFVDALQSMLRNALRKGTHYRQCADRKHMVIELQSSLGGCNVPRVAHQVFELPLYLHPASA